MISSSPTPGCSRDTIPYFLNISRLEAHTTTNKCSSVSHACRAHQTGGIPMLVVHGTMQSPAPQIPQHVAKKPHCSPSLPINFPIPTLAISAALAYTHGIQQQLAMQQVGPQFETPQQHNREPAQSPPVTPGYSGPQPRTWDAPAGSTMATGSTVACPGGGGGGAGYAGGGGGADLSIDDAM